MLTKRHAKHLQDTLQDHEESMRVKFEAILTERDDQLRIGTEWFEVVSQKYETEIASLEAIIGQIKPAFEVAKAAKEKEVKRLSDALTEQGKDLIIKTRDVKNLEQRIKFAEMARDQALRDGEVSNHTIPFAH